MFEFYDVQSHSDLFYAILNFKHCPYFKVETLTSSPITQFNN